MHMCTLHACTHAHTNTLSLCGYETGSSKHVQISQKVWWKRCVFSLALILCVLPLQEEQAVYLCALPLQEEQANTERRKKLLEEYAAKKAKSEYRSLGLLIATF